jgi:hypothetical protein
LANFAGINHPVYDRNYPLTKPKNETKPITTNEGVGATLAVALVEVSRKHIAKMMFSLVPVYNRDAPVVRLQRTKEERYF